ncbi:MAG TPA: ABC transporter ATP-binding protein [Acidobacteriota bacterium]|nr:ABC transporter ATP-binding protein [Acidobacteriota bacterium]
MEQDISASTVKVPAIRVEGVTKRYRRIAQSHRFLTLKSAFVGGNLFKLLRPDEVFTALEGVKLEVERGETFGVIGANGAGKSTLMKIVAGTTKPTEGRVMLDGKVSALIELGAGFHPEISGRENVYINGIMLGLSRREIEERFEAIVAFAELEEFIDTPVKNYSSGMYMRLGFSVAIHVDPDILVIDEVLAVGDEAFVHKCLEKIGEFKRRSKTILLVTHGMETVRRLCDRAVWINQGTVAAIGDPVRVVDQYLDWVAEQEEGEIRRAERLRIAAVASGDEAPASGPDVPGRAGALADAPYESGRWGSGEVQIDEVRFLDADEAVGHVFSTGDEMTMEIAYRADEPVSDFVFGIGIFNANGVSCYGTNTDIERYQPTEVSGTGTIRVCIPALNLVAGNYYLDVAVHRRDGYPYDYHRGLYAFRLNSDIGDVGVARLPHEWVFDGGVRWKVLGGIDRSAVASDDDGR